MTMFLMTYFSESGM